MEFSTSSGAHVVVDGGCAGQGLHKFAVRAFREQLGRSDAHQHRASRKAAASRELLVNGRPSQGRTVLRAGDIVSLPRAQAAPTPPVVAGERMRPRMAIAAAEATASDTVATSRAALAFSSYYRLQELCNADEWREVEALLRTPQPLCLRAAAASPTADVAVSELSILLDGALTRVGWAPGAWQMDLERSSFANAASPGDAQRLVTASLVGAQSCGELALQETAAMLPALALSPSADHAVLDMCAAPGGKTLQLLDAMASGARRDALGLLVSNDACEHRQQRTLRRARCGTAGAPLLASCADAAAFPELRVIGGAPLLYDRVLADVPCSGDGTLRKSPEKMNKWTVRAGLRCHATQLAILLRGLELLAPGGILAYSTCALDPLQGEAVVSAALRASHHAAELEIAPPAEVLPELTVRELRALPGLSTWRVPHPDYGTDQTTAGQSAHYGAWADVPAELRDEGAAVPLLRSMCPPAAPAGTHLGRCMRLLPTRGGGGGFFVAVLRRRDVRGPTVPAIADARGAGLCSWFEAPTRRTLEELGSFFGLDAGVTLLGALAVTSGDKADPAELSALPRGAWRLAAPASDAPRVLGVGVPIFCSMSGRGARDWWPPSAPWRVCQEGAASLAAAATRRVLRATSAAAAAELLRARRTPLHRLRALAETGDLEGSDGLMADGAAPGAVVLVLAHSARQAPPAIAGVIASRGIPSEEPPAGERASDELALHLLASDDVLAHHAARILGGSLRSATIANTAGTRG